MEIAEQRKKSERSHYQEGRDVGEQRQFNLPGLRCVKCGGQLKRVQRTANPPVNSVFRERRCLECGTQHWTREVIVRSEGSKGRLSDSCE